MSDATVVDPAAAVSSVLSRLVLTTEVHRQRLVRVLAPPEAEQGAVSSKVVREVAVSPSTATPPTRTELNELCVYFSVAVDSSTAGGHAVLRESRRVLDQVERSPLAAGLPAMPDAMPLSGCHQRRWHWVAAVTLVPSVPSWQHAQQSLLAKAELTSAPMHAAMNVASSVGHVVREAGVVAAAAADRANHTEEQADAALSESALAACHLLRASLAFEQRCQLFQSLNMVRSVQRTLALRANEHLPRPQPARGTLHGEAPAGRPTAGRAAARATASAVATAATPEAEATLDGASTAGSAGPPVAVASTSPTAAEGAASAPAVTEATTLDGATLADGVTANLAAATCPVLPPLRPVPVRPPQVIRRHLVEGGHEWYSTTSDELIESAAASPPTPADPTRSTFVRDSSGRRVVHQAALADLTALTSEIGHIVAHYGNDSAIAAVYGTGRYDNATTGDTSLQSAEAEAEVSKRLAVASALPAALRVVSRCITCEAAYQRAKASLLLHLLHAYEACDEAQPAADLAQHMTDLMAARPRLDLAAADFEESYRASTLALHLHEVFLGRLLAAHVDAAVTATAAGAAAASAHAGDDVRSAAAALEAGDLVQRSAASRQAAAGGCASVALALSRELAGMEARTLAAAQRAHLGGGVGNSSFSPPSVSRLRCLLLTHGLALSETLCALPPPEPAVGSKQDDSAAGAAAAVASQTRLGPDAGCTPWFESGAVAAAAEARAFAGTTTTSSSGGAGGGGSELPVPPLTAEELRARPTLLPTLGVWASVQRVSHELLQLRDALRRARPRLAWLPWITLLPRLTTSSAGLDAPAAPRSLVPGTAKLQKAEVSLATAKRFLAAVARDGAAAAHAPGSLGAARCVLQLLEAEKQALLLLLTRQRPPGLAQPFPPPAIGGTPDDVAVADLARAATGTLTREADEACRKLEALMEHAPPFLGSTHPEDSAAHDVLLLHAERGLSSAIADATVHREQLDAQAAIIVLAEGVGVRKHEEALRDAVTSAQASLHASETVSREVLDHDVRLLCRDLETEIDEIEDKLAEVRAVDMSEAKKQAMRQASNAVAWDAGEKAGSGGATTAAEGANSETGDPPVAKRASARREAAEAHREQQLNQLRALVALRSKLPRVSPQLLCRLSLRIALLCLTRVSTPFHAVGRAQGVGERICAPSAHRAASGRRHQLHCGRGRGWRRRPPSWAWQR